jgi:hypothetical protein
MFDALGQVLVQLTEVPQDDVRGWNTKLASGDESPIHAAYLSGFFKEANTKEYIAASELGVQIGTEMMMNLKEALKRG